MSWFTRARKGKTVTEHQQLQKEKEKKRPKKKIAANEVKLAKLELLPKQRLEHENQTPKERLASLEDEPAVAHIPPSTDIMTNSDPTPEPPSPNTVFVGKYDYDCRTDEDLGFKKGDLMYIINAEDGDWWLACSKDDGREGYVPSNYVAEWKSLDAEEWFVGHMKMEEAEKLLVHPLNSFGSYLVHQRNTTPGNYSLAVRYIRGVRHYRIDKLENGSFFLTQRVTFETLQDLVAHYSRQADGLCINLKQPCCLPEKPQTVGLSKRVNKEWDIDRHQTKLVRKLGVGHFGEVWEGLWNNTTPVAVKKLKFGTVSSQKLLQEATLMKKLHHPKLVQLYAVCTRQPVDIITELMTNGSLLEYLRGEGRSLKLPQLIDVCVQVVSGMNYLEQQDYIHRDLAARNILVGDHMICKVADFGLARVIDEDIYEKQTGVKFPIKWTAPEAAMYNRFTIKSDVWSFGVVVYEVITYGRFPYPGMTNAQVLEALLQGYRMPQPMGCPDTLYDTMLDCWREEPANRPTFETLKWMFEAFFMHEMEATSINI